MDRMAGEGNSKDSIQDWRVNVLVFDVLCFGNQNFLTQPAPAAARYALLRDLEDDFSKGVFVSQSMKVQWAGKLDALRQFSKSEGSKLPHIIDCFVRLGSTNPGELAFLQRA